MSGNNLIDSIKQNDTEVLKRIYLDNRLSFFKLANRYNIPNEVALDIYQDSIVALIENARKNKIDDLKSSVNTYLFGIGKFMIFDYLKKEKPIKLDHIAHLKIEEGFTVKDDLLTKRELQLKSAYESLGSQCREILNLFYFENKKLEEIRQILKYENKDVLKSQKSRCISHLKKIFRKNG